MCKTLEKVRKRPWVKYVDDERNIDNGIIVTLEEGYEFNSDKGCGVRGFDTVKEAEEETRKGNVSEKV